MEGARGAAPESSPAAPEGAETAGSGRGPEECEGGARPPEEAAPKRLCGYLSKFGGKGPLRGWKSRWFFYDERKCHLYYSRTAQDANPLDSIDLSSAVFDCKADAEEGTFEIHTPDRVITLKVTGPGRARPGVAVWSPAIPRRVSSSGSHAAGTRGLGHT